jgi:hypothetical protein
MRYLLFFCCLMFVMSLVGAAPADARGGKGGGGGGQGRGFGGGGGKGGGGRPKGSGQQAAKGGGQQLHRSQKQSGGNHVADNQHDLAKNRDRADKDKSADDGGNDLDEPTDAYNKKQKQLLIEQRNRDKRIAQAQHLRAIAERNGNPNLLANADRMEAAAHEHYARRVAQLEKFGVTDPLLDLGGDTSGVLPDGTTDFAVPVLNSP